MIEKVLIFYASIGSGHFSAADALRTALLQSNPGVCVELRDVFTARQRRSGLPGLLAAFSTMAVPRIYDRSWRTGSLRWIFDLARRAPWLERRVVSQVSQFSPGAVVCTHALPCAICAACLPQIPLVAVATDFYTHPYWPVQGVKAFITASEITGPLLVSRGYPAQRIYPLGIPVRPEIVSLSQLAEKTPRSGGLSVLALAGGGQIGPYLPIWPVMDALVATLAHGPLPGITWDIVFGNSRALQRRAARLLSGRPDVSLHGFVDDLPWRMARADVVLTKPGGLVLAEAMALRKPVVLLSRGVGQESANQSAVLTAGAGVLAAAPEHILAQLQRWRDVPDELERVQLGTRRLGSPESASQSARLILSL